MRAPMSSNLAAVLIISTCALVISSCRAVEELDETIALLGDDDYDVREAATDRLGNCPAGYARVLLKLSDAVNSDLEVKNRLKQSARMVFERKIGAKDDRWLALHGTLGISYQAHYSAARNEETSREREAIGMAVTWIENSGPSEQKLQVWDVITEVDGVNAANRDLDQMVKPGKEYELTVLRYEDTKSISERDYIDSADSNFKKLKIKVAAGWRKSDAVDQEFAKSLMESLWVDFLEAFKSRDNVKFAVLK
jgi:hypothetical protein